MAPTYLLASFASQEKPLTPSGKNQISYLQVSIVGLRGKTVIVCKMSRVILETMPFGDHY